LVQSAAAKKIDVAARYQDDATQIATVVSPNSALAEKA
jgi:hypothetical protein